MGEMFVIMQIGNAELERVYSEMIVPAVTQLGHAPFGAAQDYRLAEAYPEGVQAWARFA